MTHQASQAPGPLTAMEDRKNRLEKDIKQITLWCQAWSMMQGEYGTHSYTTFSYHL